MKILVLIISLSFSLTLLSGPGHKHGGGHSHSHEKKVPVVSKEKTIELGKSHIERLIKKGKIDASWKNATHEKSIQKVFKDKKEWLVTFDNENGLKGKKLYIFLKLSGEFVAANFTGK